jgi:hypothetical protein
VVAALALLELRVLERGVVHLAEQRLLVPAGGRRREDEGAARALVQRLGLRAPGLALVAVAEEEELVEEAAVGFAPAEKSPSAERISNSPRCSGHSIVWPPIESQAASGPSSMFVRRTVAEVGLLLGAGDLEDARRVGVRDERVRAEDRRVGVFEQPFGSISRPTW